MPKIAVIGGGPAGLRVAQLCSAAGLDTHLYEQKPSVGRKLLIAGKSGLNLTNDIDRDRFLVQYKGRDLPLDLWAQIYDNFDNNDLRDLARDLGQETFVSSGQKVFPQSMKAAPLLRQLVQTIRQQGGHFHVRHSLQSITPQDSSYLLRFQTAEGEIQVESEIVVLAMGGGSWSKTGSDGKWVAITQGLNIETTPLSAANCGWQVPWSPKFLTQYEGTPWKNIECTVGETQVQGELIITRYGIEGGPIYKLGHELRERDSPTLTVDFKPSISVTQLVKKAESVRRNLASELSQRWKLPPSVVALLQEQHPALFSQDRISPEDMQVIAEAVKSCEIPLTGARPIEEAISSAGGIAWTEIDHDLMLKKYPKLYACGEMLDWEAPTGGFLLQGCLATATWVARQVCNTVP